jgi:hypothetical protein
MRKPSATLAAPAVSYMVGDPSARGKGVAGASLAAVADFMSGEGFTSLNARTLATNDASARVLFRAGFACAGDPYIDPGDGLRWQTFAVICNEGRPGRGYQIRPGLVVALEPWWAKTTSRIRMDPDGWTVRSADGSRAAHTEHTLAITPDGPLVLTA